MSWTGEAEELADTQELGDEAGTMAGRCRTTGLDPRSFQGVIGAAVALGSYPVDATGTPWGDDRELVGAICDLLDLIADRWTAYVRLRQAAATERARARTILARTDNPRDKATLQQIITDCTVALDTLAPLPGRLRAAAARLNQAPEQLGETYAAVYALLAQGRRMPLNGRWITGEDPSC